MTEGKSYRVTKVFIGDISSSLHVEDLAWEADLAYDTEFKVKRMVRERAGLDLYDQVPVEWASVDADGRALCTPKFPYVGKVDWKNPIVEE